MLSVERLVQGGDLLVSTRGGGKLHVGVVVGFKNKYAISAPQFAYLNNRVLFSKAIQYNADLILC